MKTLIGKAINLFFNKQFILFIIIGIINTLSSTVFSTLYSRLLGEFEAFLPGYFTGVIISYILNTIITFDDTFSFAKFIKFCISTIPNFLIQTVVVYICINYISVPNYIAYVLAAMIGVPVTFAILKIYVFVKK